MTPFCTDTVENECHLMFLVNCPQCKFGNIQRQLLLRRPIVPTAYYSNNPLIRRQDSLVRRSINPTAHYSDNTIETYEHDRSEKYHTDWSRYLKKGFYGGFLLKRRFNFRVQFARNLTKNMFSMRIREGSNPLENPYGTIPLWTCHLTIVLSKSVHTVQVVTLLKFH